MMCIHVSPKIINNSKQFRPKVPNDWRGGGRTTDAFVWIVAFPYEATRRANENMHGTQRNHNHLVFFYFYVFLVTSETLFLAGSENVVKSLLRRDAEEGKKGRKEGRKKN